ncbi:hypothetical protein ACHAWF_014081 [Thalassiosira exigua]
MAADAADAADNDEVATVLRHFRPRPGFVSSGTDHEWPRSGPRLRQKHRRRPDRGYSSVRFEAPRPSPGCDADSDARRGRLRLTYLHDGGGFAPAFLTFEIAVATLAVRCVRCSAPDDSGSERLKAHLDGLCAKLSRRPQSADASSLFSVASRLLQILNSDLPSCLHDNTDVVGGISSSREESFDALMDRTSKFQSNHPAAIHSLVDFYTLLLRCAAAGRNRSKICAPVPAEFSEQTADGVDVLSHLLFNSTNHLYTNGFRSNQPSRGENQQQQRRSEATWSLLSFFISLPWTEGARLRRETGDTASPGKSALGKNTVAKNMIARLCLEVGDALGDPSPSVSRYSKKYGTVQAFHGTKIESAWPILNFGLQNLSYNALSQNGAMMGEGVYLSSSKQVAESFAVRAAERPPAALSSAFQHECLLHLLCLAGMDVSTLEPLDCYNIKCLPVFEATILKPPSKVINRENSDDKGSGVVTGNANSNHCTRQEGKYFVCPNSELVRLTKLHLTFELSKKSKAWVPRFLFYLTVMLVAILWMIK